MPAVSLPGLQSGLDTAALVQQLINAERGPIERLQARRSVYEDKKAAYATLRTRLETLRTAARAIRTPADLRAFNARSSNQEVLTVTTSSGATEGAHEVIVDRLAASERMVHAGLADAETALGVGTFAYAYDGTTHTIQTTDQTTLEDLVSLINNDGANPGVTASLLEYDAGDGLAWHLVLGGDDAGTDYTLTVEDAQTTLADFQAASFTTTQAARDARLRVDGYPDGAWITRSTNTIDDVLPGITLDLHSTGTVQISLTRDTEGLKDKVQDLVDAYNEAIGYIQEQTAYDEAAKSGGILMSEVTVRFVRQQLREAFTGVLPGFHADSGDAYTLAGQIGLSIDSGGVLALDDETFDEALADDYLGLVTLLGADRTGSADSDHLRFYGAAADTAAGAYDVRAVFDAGTLVSAQIKRSDEGEDDWRDATVDGNLIIGAYGEDEAWLQVTATYAGTGTVEAEVRVRQGVGGTMYETLDALLDNTEGDLAFATDQAQGAIDLLQAQIERQEERLERTEERLRAKFTKLEQTLALLEAQRGALAVQGL